MRDLERSLHAARLPCLPQSSSSNDDAVRRDGSNLFRLLHCLIQNTVRRLGDTLNQMHLQCFFRRKSSPRQSNVAGGLHSQVANKPRQSSTVSVNSDSCLRKAELSIRRCNGDITILQSETVTTKDLDILTNSTQSRNLHPKPPRSQPLRKASCPFVLKCLRSHLWDARAARARPS